MKSEPSKDNNGKKNVMRIIPNLFTLFNGLTGVWALYYVFTGNTLFASFLILSAAGFDGMDGYFARKLNVENSYGALYDSICDSISFVIAPSMMMLLFISDSGLKSKYIEYISLLVMSMLLFAGIARLTKYTIKASKLKYFEGIPTPFVAESVALFIFLNNFIYIEQYKLFIIVIIPILSIMMVSPLKYTKSSYSKRVLYLSFMIGLFTILPIVLKLVNRFFNFNFYYIELFFAGISLVLLFVYLIGLPLNDWLDLI
ncbi:MAG: CDP-alcohol phosphatidyltransferase family protein [Candidatus Thermoplasmatota archaeon]|nr:CDP-alcohol phosphatidyltransferase family protein [Candidatus Thermoplasmatota archaeon]